MRLVQLLSLAGGVASTALNPLARLNIRRPATLVSDTAPEPRRTSSSPVQAFSISDLFAQSFVVSETSWNRSLSFVFADPNSNTSAICSNSWIDTQSSTSAPTAYVACDASEESDPAEDFTFLFTTYTNIQHFSIKFSHGWNDPANYPPPYGWVTMFSTANSFNLTCATSADGLQQCSAPQNPYRAPITSIAD